MTQPKLSLPRNHCESTENIEKRETAGRLGNAASRIMGGNGVVGRSIASSLRLRPGLGLSVGKHVVPDKLDSLVLKSQLPVNDELVWDTGTSFPERCIDGIVDKVGKYEASLSGTITSIFWHRKVFVKDVKSKAAYLCTAISDCARALNWHLGLQIHAHVVRSGYEDSLFLSSALVDFYAKCGEIVNAWKVFCCMKRHDQVSWTSIISGFSHMGQGKEAIWMFKAMLDANIKPNCLTYVSVISACKGAEETFDQGTMLHAHVLKLGFNNNSFVVSSLINCYAKCGRADQAALLFDEATVRDTILFNSMITAYSLNLYSEEALKLFIRMRNEYASPTDHTLTSVLNACGCLTLLHQGRQVHSLVTKLCSEKSVFLISALIDMYSKCGSIGDARFLFDQTLEKNDVVWTSMILGYAQSGRGAEALELFERFEILGGYKLDHICFTAVLTACNHAGFVDKGIEYLNKMRRDYGLVPQLDQYACLIDLYARNGHLRRAKGLMEEMPYEPNYVMWSSFLNSCNSYGEVELGREAAYQLFKMEPWNAASYIMLANIYAKAGLWNEVAEVRKLMQQKGIRKSAGWSWVEVDKVLHVFSVGDAAHPESQNIYEELEKLNFEMKEAGYIQKHCMSQKI